NNEFERAYYDYERAEALADFKSAYLADELTKRNHFALENFESKNDSLRKRVAHDLSVIRTTLKKEPFREGVDDTDIDQLTLEGYSKDLGFRLSTYFNQYRRYYQKIYNENAAL